MEKHGVHYMVCHDGSEASISALSTVHAGLMKDDDTLTVANVWSPQKEEYLKLSLKNKYIQSVTDSNCSDLGHRYSFYSKVHDEANSGKSTRELL